MVDFLNSHCGKCRIRLKVVCADKWLNTHLPEYSPLADSFQARMQINDNRKEIKFNIIARKR